MRLPSFHRFDRPFVPWICKGLATSMFFPVFALSSKAIAQSAYSYEIGASGCPVTAIQQALAASGESLEVDGDFGSETEEAVIDFQSRNGLEVDGVVGSDTLNALGLNDLESRCGTQYSDTASYSPSSPSSYGAPITFDTLPDVPISRTPLSSTYSSSTICDHTRPYVVAVPGRTRLADVQRYVSDANLQSSRLGSFICAGSFARRSEANRRAGLLRHAGFDAQVAYRP